MADGEVVLEGGIAILAALESASRPITRIFIESRVRFERDAARIRRMAADAGVAVEIADAGQIAVLAQGKTHGGLIALAGERRTLPLEALAAGIDSPFVAMLDGIEDPYNFGQAIRALYAAGADGLVLRPRSWMSAAGVVARASAGASERMPTAVAETVEGAAEAFRGRGMQIVVAAKERAVPLYEADLTGGVFLVIGGEKRGITRSFAESADLRLSIPYGREYSHSLGTVAATAVIAFEVLRQRRALRRDR
ncbi:MAG: RNA methyltransferase [Anaerolineae bacterium]|nr:RNA methyltransferase [Anaerolineae bacterium]NUQ03761.1 RNA methyltransferase [Anaerolineae bacterium]